MKALTVPTIFTAVDKFSRVTQKMGGSVQKFAKKAEAGLARSERAFRRLTPAIGSAAKQFLHFASAAAIGAAIFGGIAFSVKSLIDYEKALASTQAITGTTNEEFKVFKLEIDAVAQRTKKSAVDIAKAFEIVGSEKPELLANAEALGKVTEAVTILSKASGDDLETSAKSLTGTMNQFNLGAEHSFRVMNALGAGAKFGSANISMLSDSMKNVGSVAADSNLSVEQTVAMLEIFAKFNLKGAEAGTKFRASLTNLKVAGFGYASGVFNMGDALREASEAQAAMGTQMEKDLFIVNTFGKENQLAGGIMLKNVDAYENMTEAVTGTSTAQEMAATNSNTLSNRLDELKNQWVNLITGANGSSDALTTVKDAVKFVTDNLDTIVSVGLKVIKFFLAWKAVNLLVVTGLKAYNIVLGISNALQKTAAISVGKNATALKAYALTTKIAAAAQKIYNVVLLGNPYLAVAAAALVLGAAIYAIFQSTEKLTTAERVNAGIQKTVIENTADQLVESKLLFRELKNLEVGSVAYNEALQKLEALQPGIIQKHNLQAGAVKDLAAAEKQLTQNIMERAAAEAISNRISETASEILDLQMSGPEEGGGVFGMNQGLLDMMHKQKLEGKQAELNQLIGSQASIESGGFDALFNKGTVPVVDVEKEKQQASNQNQVRTLKDMLTIRFENPPPGMDANLAGSSSGGGGGMPSLTTTN